MDCPVVIHSMKKNTAGTGDKEYWDGEGETFKISGSILRTLQARLENTQFLEHSMRCTQAVLAELICVELKEMGRATLNKHVYSFVFLT